MKQCLLPFVLLAVACGGTQQSPATGEATAPNEPPAPAEATAASTTAPDKPEEKKADVPKESAAMTPVVRFAEGISTPESVLYDETADRYLVSNIAGKPSDLDNNGYITELSPDGKVTKAKLVAGGQGDVKLNAPKGLAIQGGVLLVTDITTVRKFDAKTGAAQGEVPVPGATFLNDLAVATDGRVFVSDSGLKGKPDGSFERTGSDALYVIDNKGKLKLIAKSKELGAPNGLLWTDTGLLVSTFRSNELYRLDDKGVRHDVTKLPNGTLDGLVRAGDKLLVSSWDASAIYRGKLGENFEVVLPNVRGSADIGWDSKRQRLLVPRFLDNAVEVYELK